MRLSAGQQQALSWLGYTENRGRYIDGATCHQRPARGHRRVEQIVPNFGIGHLVAGITGFGRNRLDVAELPDQQPQVGRDGVLHVVVVQIGDSGLIVVEKRLQAGGHAVLGHPLEAQRRKRPFVPGAGRAAAIADRAAIHAGQS